MRQLYVEAGIEGKRTHEWRDTLTIEVLEGGGTLEHVQLLLGHKSRKTAEKYYVAVRRNAWKKRSRPGGAHGMLTLSSCLPFPPAAISE